MLGYQDTRWTQDECRRDAYIEDVCAERLEKIRNEEIHARLSVMPIEDKMIEYRLMRFGHIKRRHVSAPVRKCENLDVGIVK